MNHLDIVQRVYAEQPADKTVAGALAFLLRLLPQLPPEERAGLLRKDGGENVLAFGSVNVSVGRICYPDGRLVKVLSDVPATNGPEWLDDGYVDPGRYVPYVAPVEEPRVPDASPVMSATDIPLVSSVCFLNERDSIYATLEALRLQIDANTEKIQQQIDQAIKNAEKSMKDALGALGGLSALGKIFGK